MRPDRVRKGLYTFSNLHWTIKICSRVSLSHCVCVPRIKRSLFYFAAWPVKYSPPCLWSPILYLLWSLCQWRTITCNKTVIYKTQNRLEEMALLCRIYVISLRIWYMYFQVAAPKTEDECQGSIFTLSNTLNIEPKWLTLIWKLIKLEGLNVQPVSALLLIFTVLLPVMGYSSTRSKALTTIWRSKREISWYLICLQLWSLRASASMNNPYTADWRLPRS